MYQICCITAAAKKALKGKSALRYTPLKYENRIEFEFLPEKKLFSTKKYKAKNVPEWYDFAVVFQKALDILLGSSESTDTTDHMTLIEIPEENLHVFKAASIADVFGAMGSWNDSPPYMAQEKGMDKEYEFLSSELLKQVRLATLYAINEW